MPFKNPHPLYQTWQGMRQRCRNPNFKQWKDYGGRGISICPEWDDFHKFASDMGPKPTPRHSLDRIDNDADYSPTNCRWATKREQQRNRRGAVFVSIQGVDYRLADLTAKTGIKGDTIMARADAGFSLAEIMSKKAIPKGPKPRTHCGRGHEYTEENTRITKEGWKACRTCHNAKMRRYSAAKRGDS